MIHYEAEKYDCKEGHGPLYFMKDVSENYPKQCTTKNRICINAICLDCGKVADYALDRDYFKKNCVFENGFMNGPTSSKVKSFYDTSNRFYELKEEYDNIEEIVDIINKEKVKNK